METLTLSRLTTTGGNSGSRFHFASVSSISGEDTFSLDMAPRVGKVVAVRY